MNQKRIWLTFANWKAALSAAQQAVLLRQVAAARLPINGERRLVLLPSFTGLPAAAALLSGSLVEWGAQDLAPADAPAQTGEVSAFDLIELGCRYALVGHSERRALGEGVELIRAKLALTQSHGLTSVLCVGERLTEREAGRTEAVVIGQLGEALNGLTWPAGQPLIVAYEPVWAIGSGRPCSPDQAAAVAGLIRERLRNDLGEPVNLSVLYGGSVDSGNVSFYAQRPEFDGVLVGGASTSLEGLRGLLAG